jgi:hypothetical protein
MAVAVTLLSLVAPAAFAQQLNDALRVSQQGLQFNAHALGMGNAYSTIGADVAALRFNPATMSLSPKFSWTVTANAEGFKSTSNYYGNRVDFRTSNTSGGQLGLTLPFRVDSTRTLVVGLAYNQTKDFKSGFKYRGLNDGTRFPQFVQVLADRADPTSSLLGLSFPTYDGLRRGERQLQQRQLHERLRGQRARHQRRLSGRRPDRSGRFTNGWVREHRLSHRS